MDSWLWICAITLAVVSLGAGVFKLITPYEKIAGNPSLAWANDFSPNVVKAIGGLEALGAVGVVLPQWTGIAPILSALAAAGLAVMQAGAFGVHLRRNEWKLLPVNMVLIALAVYVTFGWYQ
ncbi:DoxX family protein [Mycobacterium sp. CBMA271]|uniref:DoxX family protein n=1 Tax=unclassified Mycobacteroides TaxID=2618759 RepID=UPI0012DCD3A3|nr:MULTISPECIES: DoxX family protein [unclassified Mycobacteroides]MUM20004.1 DoxX family protein [Mycobacteroides sp. CBMA 326]MUM20178.1 DoxX family protein [Mycobacteroides sp. CBMA 271]